MHNRRLFPILLCAVLLSALAIMLCSAALDIGRYDAVPLQTAGSPELLPDHTVRFTVPLPEEARRRFFAELDRVNRERRLPFPVSVACGIAAWADYAGRADMSMSTLIRLADEKMYRNKQEMKACRQDDAHPVGNERSNA